MGIGRRPCCCPTVSGVIFCNSGTQLQTVPKSNMHNPPATMTAPTDVTPTFPGGAASAMIGLGLDYAAGYLFFTCSQSSDLWNSLYRCNIDGSSLVKLIDGGSYDPGSWPAPYVPAFSGINFTQAVADPANQKVYTIAQWAVPNINPITGNVEGSTPVNEYWSCNYDGSGASSIITLPSTLRGPWSQAMTLGVDGANSTFFLYYVDGATNIIRLATSGLGGGTYTDIYTYSAYQAIPTAAIAPDPVNAVIWFQSDPYVTTGLQYCNYDGSGLTQPATEIDAAPAEGFSGTAGCQFIMTDPAAAEIYTSIHYPTCCTYDGSVQYTSGASAICGWGLAVGP